MGALDWSPIPARNAIADPTIPARDGASAREFPGQSRGIMAGVAALIADQGGALVSTGTGNAYVVATNSGVVQPRPGVSISFRADRDNTAPPSLNVDGTGPRAWLSATGLPLDAGTIQGGTLYTVAWFDAASGSLPAWRNVGGDPATAAKVAVLADPVTSPLVRKFRATAATYEDFASAGDGKPWAESDDVGPAILEAGEYFQERGAGTLLLPPGVARLATSLRPDNMSHMNFRGQGLGAFEQSGTELKWVGDPGAIMFDMRPKTPQSVCTGVRFGGIVLNGNGIAGRGILTRGLKDSTFHTLIRDTTKVGWDIDIDECRGPLALGQVTGTRYASHSTGSGGMPGMYTNVPFYNAGGTAGAGATADITVGSGGTISNVSIRSGGSNYVLGDVLSVLPQFIGGLTGFFFTVGNCGNAATTFLDTSQLTAHVKVTQLHPNSLNALGIKIGMGSGWLDTNSSTFTNILTLTQKGTGLEIQNSDTIEFPFVRAGNADMGGGVGIGIGIDLLAGQWDFPSSARVLRFGTVSATHGLVARGSSAFQPSTRNIVEKYNLESGELPPVIEPFAGIDIKDDAGNPIGTIGFGPARKAESTPITSSPAGTGLVATCTRSWRRVGHECFISLDYVVTTPGALATNLVVDLPFPAVGKQHLYGRSEGTGAMLVCVIPDGSSKGEIYTFDNKYPATATGKGGVSGTYQC